MLLNEVQIPILLGLSFRHYLNDPPANISALMWHLLSLLPSHTSSVRHSIFLTTEMSLFISINGNLVDKPFLIFDWWTLISIMLWKPFYFSFKVSIYHCLMPKKPDHSEWDCLAPRPGAWYECVTSNLYDGICRLLRSFVLLKLLFLHTACYVLLKS